MMESLTDCRDSDYHSANGLMFTSSKCPPRPGLENTCELPFGMAWTPLLPSDCTVISSISGSSDPSLEEGEDLPAVLCLSCLAYINVYASVDRRTGIWTCPFCGAENVAPNAALLDGALAPVLASPAIEFHQQIKGLKEGTEFDACNIVLVMDRNLPRDEALAVGNVMQSILPELAAEDTAVKLGLVVFGKSVSVYQLGISGMAFADVLTARGLADDHLRDRSYLAQVQVNDSLECLWSCLSAVYGVSLQNENDNEAEVMKPLPPTRLEKLRQKKEERLRKQSQNSNARSADQTKSAWTTGKQRMASAQPFRNTGEAIECAIKLCSTRSGANEAPLQTGRVLLFTNGCPNFGVGSVVSAEAATGTTTRKSFTADIVDPPKLNRAVQHFGAVAESAARDGIAIDVLCTGATDLGLPSYQALVEPSAGYVLPHECFTSPHLEHNLSYLMKSTFACGQQLDGIDSSRGKRFSGQENFVDDCVVELRMSSFLKPTHLVGPVDPLQNENRILNSERAAFARGSSLAAKNGIATNNLPSQDILESSLTRLKMGRFDPITTLSVILASNEVPQRDSYAFIQCTVRYVDRRNKKFITKVLTNRLSIAKDAGEFLDAVNEEVVSVVIGKEAVHRSMFGRGNIEGDEIDSPDATQLEGLAYDAQRDLDATVQRISGAFRLLGLEQGSRSLNLTEEGGIKALGSSIDFAFPPVLADALRRLYHLRRGPLLAPGPIQSMDDRAEVRSLFMRLPLEECLSMMTLTLWSSGPLDSPDLIAASSMEKVPPETVALWENCIIAADNFFTQFVWSGRATMDPSYDPIRKQFETFLTNQTNQRFPMPQLHLLSEGDSMSRRFTPLLAPSHGDPVDHQLASFPALARLSSNELNSLRSKFRFYDPLTDPSFRNWFWKVASATSVSKDEGMSLCE